MPIRDATEASAYQQDYQRTHKPRLYAAKRRRWAEQKAYIWEAKNKPCADCGVKYGPWVMDFDHVGGVKRCNVSEFKRRSASWDTIKDEIAKCDVVCANCHRQRGHDRALRQRATVAAGPPNPEPVGSTPTAGATLIDMINCAGEV